MLKNIAKNVWVITRSANQAAELSKQGIRPLWGDLDAPSFINGLPQVNAIYYFAPPDTANDEDNRLSAFLKKINALNSPEKFIYLSTTGVYGDTQGKWVTEQCLPNPQNQRSKRRMNAENQLISWQRSSNTKIVILRCSGIVGPGRFPVKAIEANQPVVNDHPPPLVNLIHVDDLIQICCKVIYMNQALSIYNISDGHPLTLKEYYFNVADAYNLPRPPTITLAEAENVFSRERLSFIQESRKVSPQKVLYDYKSLSIRPISHWLEGRKGQSGPDG